MAGPVLVPSYQDARSDWKRAKIMNVSMFDTPTCRCRNGSGDAAVLPSKAVDATVGGEVGVVVGGLHAAL